MVLDIVPLATIGGYSLIGMCGCLWDGPEQRIATCQRPEPTTAPLTARLRTHLRRAGGRAQGHAIPGKASAAELLPIQFAPGDRQPAVAGVVLGSPAISSPTR